MGTVTQSIRHCLVTLGMAANSIFRVLWAIVCFLFFRHDERLHTARFAKASELAHLVSSSPPADGLLLGSKNASHFLSVRQIPTPNDPLNLPLLPPPTRPQL